MEVTWNCPCKQCCELFEMKNGYGSAVVNRLLKTSIKKNLYWEEKEKIF